MHRDRGAPPQLPLRSPLGPSNLGGGGAAPIDVVGSSTKDRAWQRHARVPAASESRAAVRGPPLSDRKKSKKVEGMVLEGSRDGTSSAAKQPPSASRIPAGRGAAAPAAAPAQQKRELECQQPTPATSGGSRIPRPPVAAGAASPQPDLVAMLATPAAPPVLPELHAGGNLIGCTPALGAPPAGAGAAAAPQGFQAFSNPSFDGAALLGTPAVAGAVSPAVGSGANMFVNGLAEASEAGDAGAHLTPGLLDPAALTPNSERSLEAWLCSSPASAPAASGPRTLRARPPIPPSASVSAGRSSSTIATSEARTRAAASAATSGSHGASRGRALPTPEAWHLLQHINDDSPAAAPRGVRGIMNAYLRTGPQALSPEPSGAGVTGLIRAPGAAAVPASGLLNVAGPGGAGVMGMMNAYLRTGAHMLSPEPGLESSGSGVAAAGRQVPLLHPYSPVSPLAATPGPAAAHAAPPAAAAPAGQSGRPISPSSVCSNGEVGSSSPATLSVSPGGGTLPPSVPRLNLSGLLQQQGGNSEGAPGGTDGTEVSFGAALRAAASPDDGELPTARLSPVAAKQQQDSTAAEAGGAAERCVDPAPSPITFCLPGDPPPPAPANQEPTSAAPSFSFAFGHMPSAAVAAQQREPEAGAAGAAGAAEAHDGGAAAGPVLQSIDSGETVQQPTLYNAMLDHLRGPQYASPARFAVPQRADSPQSPQQCTPLHLISTSDASPPTGDNSRAIMATPAPGQGSLTVWMDRRGMRAALSTPARNDLRLLWAAAREVCAYQSEAAALRADNAALMGELEAAQEALRELGVEHDAAVVAAEAGALCAEAEVARARDAAGHMMALADQIQGMFALCENEKESLVQELEAAREQLAQSEAAAVGTAHLSEQQRTRLEAQLDDARQAVEATQAAANAAQQRAADASRELTAIRRQLSEAQAQLAGVQAVQRAAQEHGQQTQAQQAPAVTPMARLRGQLSDVHDSLAQLHAEHRAGRLHASTPQLDKLWEASRAQLARIEVLLGADPAVLRAEQGQLQACLDRARTLLAKHTPATGIPGSGAAGPAGSVCGSHRSGSPVPFALFGRLSSEGEGVADGSPASSAAAASPDVFSSPFLAASETTLTVDYRALHSDLRSSWRQQSETPASRGSTACSASASPPLSQASSEGSASCGANEGLQASDSEAQGVEPCWDAAADAGGEAEREYTVVHNGMIITHVPASEVSKVRSMVQYWEAVASGTPMVEAAAAAGVTAEEAAAAEAYANAAVAAAEAALAERERAAAASGAEQQSAEQQLQAGQDWAVAMAQAVARELQEAEAAGHVHPVGSQLASPAEAAAQPSPAATPSSLTARLPVGEAATPCSQPVVAAGSPAGTPPKFTPLNFVAAPPPTPADGIDPQQAQQLHSLAVGMAAATVAAGTGAGCSGASTPAGTPAASLRTASRLPATPAGTPHSVGTPTGTPQGLATPAGTPASSRAAAAALAVTPLALSALRARMHGSGGGVQDAVRSRLARLKADLQAAQAKLATVDQGLASIAFTPTCSTSGTPGSRSSSMLHRRTPGTPPSGGPLGSPITASGSPSLGGSSRAAALIAAGGASPLAPAGASPVASSQVALVAPALPAVGAGADRQVASPAGVPAVAAPLADCTPPVTRRSVRFAANVPASSGDKGPLRVGTPHSSVAAAGAEAEEEEGQDGDELAAAASPSPASQSASPIVASCPRGPPGWSTACTSPAAGTAAAGQRRSPLAPMQSAVKPVVGGLLGQRFGLGSGNDGSSDDEDSELLYDASRMAQRANRAAAATPLRAPTHTEDGATPMAHPERPGWQAAGAQGEEGSGSVAAGARARRHIAAGATHPAASVLSTSSFSPPQPLVLLAVRPLGRARRGAGAGLLRGGGRLRGEAEEREFRRRAAALNIQVSPYFRRGGGSDRQ